VLLGTFIWYANSILPTGAARAAKRSLDGATLRGGMERRQ
jgi:hypothetical protein